MYIHSLREERIKLEVLKINPEEFQMGNLAQVDVKDGLIQA